MAIVKTLNANGSKGHHKFTLEVVENVKDDSIATNTTYVDYTFKISALSNGYDWNSWGSRISYTITIGDNTYTGTIPAYDGSSTVTLKYANNIAIVHESDGTKTINVGFSVSDSTGQSYTCGTANASDTMTLTALHTPPSLTLTSVVENNSTIGQNTTFVNYLSDKTFTVSYSFNDNATASALKIYTRTGNEITSNKTTSLGVSSGTLRLSYLSSVTDADIINNKTLFYLEITDSLGGKTRIATPEYNFIMYKAVNLEATACKIKRYGQASGEASLTIKGTWFDGSVGNTNNLLSYIDLLYKKPSDVNWTSISVPLSANTGTNGNIEIIDWLIKDNNVVVTDFDKEYTYDVMVTIGDRVTRGLAGLATLTLSKGVWIMAKYKDHVDFISATIGNTPIIESGSNANGEYIKYYDGTMICTKVVSGAEDITSAWGSMYESSAISLGDTAETFTSTPLVFATNQTSTNTGYFIENVYGSSASSFGSTILTRPNSANNIAYSISLMAIGKWR